MESKPTVWAQVDEQGRLVLPTEVAARYGLKPGAKVRLDEGDNDIRMHRPVTQLNKVYIEPTSLCNLDCRTCIRNCWEETLGRMKEETFERVLDNIQKLSPRPTVFFGGLGEPLFHPRTEEWIARVKDTGARVEMITNGTMLTKKKSQLLIEAGLDVLWVSIDGATPESYEDVRLGAELPQVLENLARFREMRPWKLLATPEIGIAFVAMKRNIADLPEVLKIGKELGAKRFSISNVLPYTAELQDERLYTRTLNNITYLSSPWLPRLSIPKMDINDLTRDAIIKAFNSACNVTFAGNNLAGANDACVFIESGSVSIGWQGDVSPCLALLHTHEYYLHGKPHQQRKHIIGNIADHELLDLWNDPEYQAYRERVQRFAFAPCTFCGGCDLSEANEEDCIANPFPACGGCLWAQGVIQCP
jgi:MoaA/NifB/PqqE/SkfB family radical SAM enzyme